MAHRSSKRHTDAQKSSLKIVGAQKGLPGHKRAH